MIVFFIEYKVCHRLLFIVIVIHCSVTNLCMSALVELNFRSILPFFFLLLFTVNDIVLRFPND